MPEGSTEFRKVTVAPVDCLKESKTVLGDQYWLFVGICFVGLLIAYAVPFGILAGPMMCGIFLCYFQRMKGENTSFDVLFKGFDYFVESLIATLIILAITIVVMFPLMCVVFAVFGGIAAAAGADGGDDAVAVMIGGMYLLVLGLSLIVNLAVGTLFMFVYPLIVDRGLKAMPAIRTSCQAALANLGGLVGLVLLMMVLGALSFCLCMVGYIFVMPICLGAVALAYRKVFPEEPPAAMDFSKDAKL